MIAILVWNKYKQSYFNQTYEGFTQTKPFVLKTNAQSYDDFYSEIYDIIHKPARRTFGDLKVVINQTMPTPEHSVFLDIGCGTGYVVNELASLGFNAFGVDKSQAMINYATQQYPRVNVEQADVMDTMSLNKNTFTHILCLYFTIYEIEDKVTLFRNCYYWLKPGGYLIIHLLDPHKFNRRVPSHVDPLFGTAGASNLQKNTINFFDFDYQYEYIVSESSTVVSNMPMVFKETFTDKKTNHIRQNENVLFVEPVDSILKKATQNGFIVKGNFQVNEYNDSYQYLYILERLL
jgi:SAM-dependent methyltransferase